MQNTNKITELKNEILVLRKAMFHVRFTPNESKKKSDINILRKNRKKIAQLRFSLKGNKK